MFFCRLKQVVVAALALLLALAVGLAVKMGSVCKLSAVSGERTFYLHSASSQGLRKERLRVSELGNAAGESVRFFYDGNGENVAREIAETYGAEILFVEESCGKKSFYCFVGNWNHGLSLYGERVNLHIAFGDGVCAVGTPIIFDGF